MRGLALSVYLLSAMILLPAQQISGDWHGSIEVPDDAPLRLALHIVDPHTATLDSADEGVTALPVDSIAVQGASVKFEIKSISGIYKGTVTPDGSRINGTWAQDGGTWPLNWERGEDPTNSVKPLAPGEAREAGGAYTRWFYEGKIEDLWRKLSPVVKQAFVNEQQFAEFRQQTVRRLGSETGILSESVTLSGDLQVYRRVARFRNAQEAFELQFGLNPVGVIAVFSIDTNPVKAAH